MSSHNAIPQLPPHRGDSYLPDFVGPTPTSGRSPFVVSTAELVRAYGSTDARCDLLEGLINFRSRARKLGINGIQWLDGSFVSDVETREGRPPNDIDVVTHFQSSLTQQQLFAQDPELFQQQATRKLFGIDHYWFDAGRNKPFVVLQVGCYWHGMWSRSKDPVAPASKGYIALILDASDADDLAAQQAINTARTTP